MPFTNERYLTLGLFCPPGGACAGAAHGHLLGRGVHRFGSARCQQSALAGTWICCPV